MKKSESDKSNPLLLILVPSLIVNIFALAVLLKPQLNKIRQAQTDKETRKQSANIFNEINPEKGYEIKATYGNLGPRMIEAGVIDFDKFKATYEKSGSKMTQDQIDILTKGSDKKIRITRDNSYFLLNFFWAAGLMNKSKILTQGDMLNYGGLEGAANFASTGGWTLTKSGQPMDYFATQSLIPMSEDQETMATKISGNIYRPCCDNSTAFPDCNHGMALMAVIQLLASQGASEKDIYQAGKYFNAFWFPGNYYDLALYFKNKDGRDFKDVPAKEMLSKQFSSASGWSKAKQWLADKGIIAQPPKQGGGACGV